MPIRPQPGLQPECRAPARLAAGGQLRFYQCPDPQIFQSPVEESAISLICGCHDAERAKRGKPSGGPQPLIRGAA